ncbi:hypothetical protein ACFP2T_02375 [Plantactinospora solaniradicis]|uniref:RHIM domain-containing protein n=1 Tax=Plantactinospora solaniradicis TaxID=1723736 RepID=A0ABW1K272_9ACTN
MAAELLEVIMPPVFAAVGAYGQKVLSTAEDEAAGATVRLGQQLLSRLRRTRSRTDTDTSGLDAAVVDVAANPDDADFQGALRAQVKKALAGDDPELTRDLLALFDRAGISVSASGRGAVAVRQNDGIVSTGEGATNTINRK